MKPEIAKKWVAALRSGDYKQTKGALRNRDSFCCLGVLCNLHAKAHPKIAAGENDPSYYLGKVGLPPNAVVVWAGLSDSDPLIGRAALSSLNDGGMSFKKIANLIAANVEKL